MNTPAPADRREHHDHEANHGPVREEPGNTLRRDAKAVRAIDDVNFDATEGKYLCVVGPSERGRPTLLKCLSSPLPITSGTVDFLGPPACGPPEGLSLVFQDYN